MPTTQNFASIKPSLDNLQAIERELTVLLVERDEVIRAAIIALLARQHLVILGPPGTAKSALIHEIAQRISPQTGAGLQSFNYLMTRFTTPEELFGPVSVSGLKQDEYRRITAGKLVEAELVFLDEIFKASSSILNALLKIVNERVFNNGNQEVRVPLISLFGASNELPQGNDLEALWDRFLLRIRVSYTSDSGFSKLVRAAATRRTVNGNGQTTNGLQSQTLLHSELISLQQSATQVSIPGAILSLIEQLRKELMVKGITISDRRWGQILDVLQANALIEGRSAVTEDDLTFLKHCLWQTPEQQADIGKLIARLGNPLNSKAIDLGDQATSVYQDGMQVHKIADTNDKKIAAAIEANAKLKTIINKLQELRGQAVSQGKNTGRIDKVIEQVAKMREEFINLAL
jgi:MoxR-like ATPase